MLSIGNMMDVPDPGAQSARDLIDLTIAPHHEYLHRTLPFLQTLAGNSLRVDGDHDPALHDLARLLDQLVETLEEQLEDEETLLFPALAAGHPEEVRAMLADARREHALVAALLSELRRAAGDYHAPEWACDSYRTLVAELAALEADALAYLALEEDTLLSRYA